MTRARHYQWQRLDISIDRRDVPLARLPFTNPGIFETPQCDVCTRKFDKILFWGEDREVKRKDNLFFLNRHSHSAKSSREPRRLFSGLKIVPASRESRFTVWYFFSRAAATFLQGEIGSRELRRLFYRMILSLASCGSFSTEKKLGIRS